MNLNSDYKLVVYTRTIKEGVKWPKGVATEFGVAITTEAYPEFAYRFAEFTMSAKSHDFKAEGGVYKRIAHIHLNSSCTAVIDEFDSYTELKEQYACFNDLRHDLVELLHKIKK